MNGLYLARMPRVLLHCMTCATHAPPTALHNLADLQRRRAIRWTEDVVHFAPQSFHKVALRCHRKPPCVHETQLCDSLVFFPCASEFPDFLVFLRAFRGGVFRETLADRLGFVVVILADLYTHTVDQSVSSPLTLSHTHSHCARTRNRFAI